MVRSHPVHIAAGGNRQPNVADWTDEYLIFGSGNNVAVWRPHTKYGVVHMLRGHTDTVNTVQRLHLAERHYIVTGSADKTLRLWSHDGAEYSGTGVAEYGASVKGLSTLTDCDTFVSGGSDATVKIWRITPQSPDDQMVNEKSENGQESDVRESLHLLQTIRLRPRFLPLATSLVRLSNGSLLFAVAGTSPVIQLFIQEGEEFQLAATLTGHEGWIQSLAFTRETESLDSDLLLASASQDKYVRLWRIRKGSELPQTSTATQDPSLGVLARSLSNKPHYVGKGQSLHSVTFEALLIGHEDWIYTAKWKLGKNGPALLTTSADNSVSVWTRESDSGFWICETRLGEISAQKGSTTATGSAGGFWIGLWSPSGDQIASLGRTGSWKLWRQSGESGAWEQEVGISGHTKEVKSLAWARDGSYLLTTGSDQTTRLIGAWKNGATESWHEIARPQIHGYDLNCVDTLGSNRFISGADEKLLRVFNKPKSTARLLAGLQNISESQVDDLPDVANMPVLGLSNKAITDGHGEQAEGREGGNGISEEAAQDLAEGATQADVDHPPFEDVLSRHSLWPEHEKLYGHGYEISIVAASHDGKLVATACRASSIDHAVIRLYETTDWREIKPPLSNHSLTVTSLAFSPSDDKLLSVGRDRQWTVFERNASETTQYRLKHSNPKGHSRMILDCTWAPSTSKFVFATAGRDKNVKIWAAEGADDGYDCKLTMPTSAAATAVSFCGNFSQEDHSLIAYGTEEGNVVIALIDISSWTIKSQQSLGPERPSGAINALRWRPRYRDTTREMLAVASDDHSVRLYEVDNLEG